MHRGQEETPCVRDIHPLVGPTKGDGDLEPWAIAGVGGGVFCSDGEHPPGDELPFSSAPKDGGDHLVVVLEGIVIAPRWSVASSFIVGVIV